MTVDYVPGLDNVKLIVWINNKATKIIYVRIEKKTICAKLYYS